MTRCDPKQCAHVMRARCTECGREQYGPIIRSVSHGELRCPWCGRFNQVAVRLRSA